MKRKILSLMRCLMLAAAILPCLCSCYDETKLSVKSSSSENADVAENVTLDSSNGSSKTIYVSVEKTGWTARVAPDCDFLSVSPERGTESGYLTITATSDNVTGEDRTGTIYIESTALKDGKPELSQTIKITQTVAPIKVYTVEGTFYMQNLTTGEIISDAANVIKDDEIFVTFTPTSDNQDKVFSISCNNWKRISDNVFVVPNLAKGTYSVEFNATCSEETAIYQATQTLSFTVPESYIIIPEIVRVSDDLLRFVDVDLCYTDKDGAEHEYRIKEKDWMKYDDFMWYTYKDENGNIHESTEVPEGCEVLKEEILHDKSSHFILNTRFLNLQNDITTTFTARYTLKENLEFNKDSYEFKHSIDRQSATISVPGTIVIDNYFSLNISININIGVGTDDISTPEETKEKVISYLEELSNTPDIKKFQISTNGHITTIK